MEFCSLEENLRNLEDFSDKFEYLSWGGRDGSVVIATGYGSTVRGSNPGGGEIFRIV